MKTNSYQFKALYNTTHLQIHAFFLNFDTKMNKVNKQENIIHIFNIQDDIEKGVWCERHI